MFHWNKKTTATTKERRRQGRRRRRLRRLHRNNLRCSELGEEQRNSRRRNAELVGTQRGTLVVEHFSRWGNHICLSNIVRIAKTTGRGKKLCRQTQKQKLLSQRIPPGKNVFERVCARIFRSFPFLSCRPRPRQQLTLEHSDTIPEQAGVFARRAPSKKRISSSNLVPSAIHRRQQSNIFRHNEYLFPSFTTPNMPKWGPTRILVATSGPCFTLAILEEPADDCDCLHLFL